MEYQEMKRLLDVYNWDDGFAVPQKILEDPDCDLALALEIFFLADGYTYLDGMADSPDPAGWREFIRRLADEIIEGRYPKTERGFRIPIGAAARYKWKKRGITEAFFTDL